MSEQKNNYPKPRLVPVPSTNIIPERDIDKRPILECRHLGVDFGGLTAVDDFNMAIGRTEIAGLIGPNGAGKTTVFNLLTKVYQPTRGTVMIDGRDTAGKSTIQVSHMGVARTFQNIRLFNNLTVEDNVKIGLHEHTKYSALSGILRLPSYWKKEKEAHEKTLELLRYILLPIFLFWPFSNVLPAILRSGHDSVFPSVLSLASMWCVRIVCGYFLAYRMGMGLTGLWTAMWVEWAVRSVVLAVHYFRRKWLVRAVPERAV